MFDSPVWAKTARRLPYEVTEAEDDANPTPAGANELGMAVAIDQCSTPHASTVNTKPRMLLVWKETRRFCRESSPPVNYCLRQNCYLRLRVSSARTSAPSRMAMFGTHEQAEATKALLSERMPYQGKEEETRGKGTKYPCEVSRANAGCI